MIEPKEITIVGGDNIERKFIISKIPYASGGREICSQYLPTAMPKVGDYQVNHQLFLKMMNYVEAVTDNGNIRLTTAALIDNWVSDFQTGIKLEKEMLEYNLGFFDTGKILSSLQGLTKNAQPLIIKILSQLQGFSSQNKEQRSMNSKKNTH